MSGGAYQSDPRSCVNTRCTSSDQFTTGDGVPICLPEDVAGTDTTSEGMYCPVFPNGNNVQIQITDTLTNCCFAESNHFNTVPMGDSGAPCCEGVLKPITTPNGPEMCLPLNIGENYVPVMQNGNQYIVCVGAATVSHDGSINTGYPNGTQIHCDGRLVLVDTSTNKYSNPITSNDGLRYDVSMVYYNDNQHATPINVGDNASNWFIHYNE